jgi:hypothetical protein
VVLGCQVWETSRLSVITAEYGQRGCRGNNHRLISLFIRLEKTEWALAADGVPSANPY